MENPGGWNLSISMGTDYRKPVSFNMHNSYGEDAVGGWMKHACGGINVRPNGAVSMSIHPSWNYSRSMSFYVTRVADPTATATFGTRYVNAELVRTSLAATVRVDVALSPDLSIQLYAQPFVSKGTYSDVRELEDARSASYDDRYRPYDNADVTADPGGFNVKQFRSNVVLRWEYLPGSTVFLVWNQGRHSTDTLEGDRSITGDFRELFGLRADNSFLIKASYWINW